MSVARCPMNSDSAPSGRAMSAATRARALPLALIASVLAACATTATTPKGTLDRSQVETVRVEGRLYEVRVAPAEVEGEYRLLIVRGTIVIDPDPQLESQRLWNV